jgi:hypothetical protein
MKHWIGFLDKESDQTGASLPSNCACFRRRSQPTAHSTNQHVLEAVGGARCAINTSLGAAEHDEDGFFLATSVSGPAMTGEASRRQGA